MSRKWAKKRADGHDVCRLFFCRFLGVLEVGFALGYALGIAKSGLKEVL